MFGGWYDNENFEGEPFNFDTAITENKTLYAKWTAGPYTVSFEANGANATGMPVAQKVEKDANATAPEEAPAADGLVFDDWYGNAGCTGDAFDFESTPITADKTLYAKWTAAPVTVTFDANGVTPEGYWPADQTTTYGGAVTAPGQMPASESKNFVDWYTNASCEGDAYNFATPVTTDLTLYAKWTNKVYRQVTFNNADHGTQPEDGLKATNPGKLSEDGWVFGGWINNGAVYDFNTPVTADLELVAKWTEYYPEDYMGDDKTGPKTTITVEPGYELYAPKKNPDGTPVLDADGKPVYEKVADGDGEGGLPKTYTANDGEEVKIRRKGDANHDPSDDKVVVVNNGYVGTPVLSYNNDRYDPVDNPITYTGQPQTVVVGPYTELRTLDPSKWTVTGDSLTQTKAGTYTATVTPKDGNQWLDGSVDEHGKPAPKLLTWSIGKGPMTKVPAPSVDRYTGRITVPKATDGSTKYPDGTPYAYEYKPAGSSAWVRVPATGFVTNPNTTYDFRIATSNNTFEGQAVQATYVPLTPAEREAGLTITASNFSIKASEVAGLNAAKVIKLAKASAKNGRGEAVALTPNWSAVKAKAGRYNVTFRTPAGSTKTVVCTVTADTKPTPTPSPTPTPTPTPTPPNLALRCLIHLMNRGDVVGYSGEIVGTTGQSRRAEGIGLAFIDKGGYTGSIEYTVHMMNRGWDRSWKRDGEYCGTRGQNRRIEAMCVRLTGDLAADYDVWYHAHVQNVGWMGWAKNGLEAGTTGRSLRMEAYEVVVLPKGSQPPSTSVQITNNRLFMGTGVAG